MNDILHPKENVLIMADFNLHVERKDGPDGFSSRKCYKHWA